MKSKFKISILLMMTFGLFISCSTEDESDNPVQLDPAIVLDCNYFKENRILTKNPNAAVDYIITCKMHVAADIVVEPGVVIEFEQDAGIDIDDFNTTTASFSAKGTAAKPIIFRGTVSTKGYWRGLLFDSNNTKNTLEHVQIDGAGGKSFNSNGDRGAIIVWANARLNLNNSTISNSETYGLNAGYGGSTIQIMNNDFKGNNIPVKISPEYIDTINSSNDFMGNTENVIYVESGSISNPATWKKVNVPYSVMNFSTYGYSGGVSVKKALTIEPGVLIEFDGNTALAVRENGGSLVAIGTQTEPIIFSAINKVAGGWEGIYSDSKSVLNEIAFAEFNYSGGSLEHGSVRLWYNSVLNIHDVTFRNIRNCAILHRTETGLTTNNITLDPGACLKAIW